MQISDVPTHSRRTRGTARSGTQAPHTLPPETKPCCDLLLCRVAIQLCVGLGEERLSGGDKWLEAKDRAFGGYLSSSRWEFKGSIVTSAVLPVDSGLWAWPYPAPSWLP